MPAGPAGGDPAPRQRPSPEITLSPSDLTSSPVRQIPDDAQPRARAPRRPVDPNAATEERRARARRAKEAETEKPKAADPDKPSLQSVIMTPPRRNKRKRSPWAFLSYALLVLLPVLFVALYYAFIASDQYRVTSQFSVRGSQSSPLAELGLGALPGVSTQNDDSYIVKSYMESRQLIVDIQQQLGVDLRTFYSKPDIDPLYRIRPDMPIEEFENYWRWLSSVEFNSTTGNSTLVVTAFSTEDAKRVSELVFEVSQKLVNDLSRESRNLLISIARQEVQRAENRLSGVRAKLTELRNREQAVSPDQIASVKVPVIAELERQLAELKIRRTALTSTLSSGESPAMRVIDRQIEALSQQLAEQRALIGTGTDSEGNPGSLSGVVAEYTQLTVDEQFATQAYTTALASLETALAEAQKKQRYFATFVAPYSPDASIYPQRMLNTILAFLTLSVFWLIGYFMVRSVYDHAV